MNINDCILKSIVGITDWYLLPNLSKSIAAIFICSFLPVISWKENYNTTDFYFRDTALRQLFHGFYSCSRIFHEHIVFTQFKNGRIRSTHFECNNLKYLRRLLFIITSTQLGSHITECDPRAVYWILVLFLFYCLCFPMLGPFIKINNVCVHLVGWIRSTEAAQIFFVLFSSFNWTASMAHPPQTKFTETKQRRLVVMLIWVT